MRCVWNEFYSFFRVWHYLHTESSSSTRPCARRRVSVVIVMYGISVMCCRSSSLSSSLFFFHLFLLTHFIKFSLLCSLYTSVSVVKRVFVYSRWRNSADTALVKLFSVFKFLFQKIALLHTSRVSCVFFIFIKFAFVRAHLVPTAMRGCLFHGGWAIGPFASS